MSRTKKQPYRGSRRFDRSCRNHGSCGYCFGNRMHNHHKKEMAARHELEEYQQEEGVVWVLDSVAVGGSTQLDWASGPEGQP